MDEFEAAKCPVCGTYNTHTDRAWRKCRLCGAAWDRIYQDEKGRLVVGALR